MIFSTIILFVGIFLGQEYVALPSVKIMSIQLFETVRNEIHKFNESKN